MGRAQKRQVFNLGCAQNDPHNILHHERTSTSQYGRPGIWELTLNRSKPRCKYDRTATHRCESRSRDTARLAERTESHARLNAESTPPSSFSAAPLARSGGRSPSARPRLRVATRTLPVPRSLRCTAVEDLGERGEGRRREPTAPARTPTAHTPSQLRRRPNRTYTTRLGMRPQGPAAGGREGEREREE